MAGRPGAGRYSGKLFETAVRRAACAQIRAGDLRGQRKLDVIAARLVNQAVDGDLDAIKTVAERLDGKAVAHIEASGDGALLAGFGALLAAVNEERRRRAASDELGPPIVDVTPEYGAVQQHSEVVDHDPEDAKHAEKPVE
jgi:hypothetical protein